MLPSMYSVARSTASASSSIAESTACSAASEYGGVRSLYGSRAAGGLLSGIEYASSELDIFPGGSLPGLIAQQSRGVIRDDQRDSVISVHRAAQLPDRRLGVQ